MEFQLALKCGVWRQQELKQLLAGRKAIGTKWVFKEKRNGVFQARLVTKGYDQVPGIDFKFNSAPITTEAT